MSGVWTALVFLYSFLALNHRPWPWPWPSDSSPN